MNLSKLMLCLVAVFGTGCAMLPSPAPLTVSDMPNCFESNYDAQRKLFTLNAAAGNTVSQQCLLTVVPRGTNVLSSRLAAGPYAVYFADGGGGGAGGTKQAMAGGGGGGGGGAGARETRVALELEPGLYALTIGAGGPGGNACSERPFVFGGGPGSVGSPTNMVRVATGAVVAGTAGAESYVRPTRAQNEKSAGKVDGHGGSGPGQTTGGHGATVATAGRPAVPATDGQDRPGVRGGGTGGDAGVLPAGKAQPGNGGGGGATSLGDGGDGGGGRSRRQEVPPERGTLGSGGGGGIGNQSTCEPGARGGHGYIALRAL